MFKRMVNKKLLKKTDLKDKIKNRIKKGQIYSKYLA